MKEWTIEEEAARLKARFEGKNRAKFARENEVPGGQAMIYQHINGLRPIGLDAAIAYMRGFGCGLDEISPRLVEELAKKNAAMLPEKYMGMAQEAQLSVQEQRADYGISAEQREWLDLIDALMPEQIEKIKAIAEEYASYNQRAAEHAIKRKRHTILDAIPAPSMETRDILKKHETDDIP